MELSFDHVFEHQEWDELDHDEVERGRLTPFRHLIPAGFTRLARGVYRSGCPDVLYLDVLEELHVNTIVNLSMDTEYSMAVTYWVMRTGVNVLRVPLLENNDPGVESSPAAMDFLLRRILDPRNHPIVIHCDTGARQAACVVGCIRKIQGWISHRFIREYQEYPGAVDGLSASLDIQYILDYHPSFEVQQLAYAAGITTRRPVSRRRYYASLLGIAEE